MKKTDSVFKRHPKLTTIFQTNDGFLFFTLNAAQNHAKTLEKKSIKTIDRPAKIVDDSEAEEKAKQEAANKAKKEAEEKAKQEAAEGANVHTLTPNTTGKNTTKKQ